MTQRTDDVIRNIQERKRGYVESEDGQSSIGYFTKLNSDPAHFVWELIQNAEDVNATEISFTLHDKDIWIQHNGVPFNDSNVLAICSILRSDKELKYGQIGKFGAGFKTVFAYTDAPEIYSGEFSFKITNLVFPNIITNKPSLGLDTLFIIPFRYPAKARSDVSQKLGSLSTSSLLFLKNIKKIRININGIERVITRQTNELLEFNANIIFEDIIVSNNDKNKEYYRFTLSGINLEDIDDSGNSETIENQSVMIAFPLDSEHKIAPIKKTGDVDKFFVFFPTEIKTDLQYLVHAPFKTTINRETIIESSKANKTLYSMIIKLVVSSIFLLIKRGELTADFYNQILFPGGAQFPTGGLYDLLKSHLIKTIGQNIPMLPTIDGTIAKLSEILIETYSSTETKGLIKKIFSVDDIASHINKFKNRKYWDSGYFNTNLYRLIKLTMEDYNPGYIEISITELIERKNMTNSWLSEMSNEQLKKFYTIFLDENNKPTSLFYSPSGKDAISHLTLVRNPIGKQLHHSEVYWRESDIHPFFMEDKYCNIFLKELLNIKEYDDTSALKENIYHKYSGFPSVSIEENVKDIEAILTSVLNKKINAQEFENIRYVCCVDSINGKIAWKCPRDVYLTKITGGSEIVETILDKVPEIYFAHPKYECFSGKLEYLGLKSKIILTGSSENQLCISSNVEMQIRDTGKLTRGNVYIFPKDEFKPDSDISNIKEILSTMTPLKSIALYKWLSNKGNVIKGVIDWSTNRHNSITSSVQHGTLEVFSQIGYRLYNSPWIYGSNEKPYIPRNIPHELIREEYLSSPEILEKLGNINVRSKSLSAIVSETTKVSEALKKSLDILEKMSPEALAEFQEEYGGSKRSVKSIFESLLEQNKEDYSIYEENDEEDDYDPSSVIDVEKRRKKVKEEMEFEITDGKKLDDEMEDSRKKSINKLLISASKDEKLFLETLDSILIGNKMHFSFAESANKERDFLQQEYGGRCQICGTRIKKALKKGSKKFPYHFIARNVIKTGDIDCLYHPTEIVEGWNSLSLCPMCAAKYIYCSKNLNSFRDQVMAINIRPRVPEIFEIKIMLDGKMETIHYTPKHMLALQEALKFFDEYEKQNQNEEN